MNKVFDISKEREAKATIATSLDRPPNSPIVGHGLSNTTEIPPVSSSRDHPSIWVVVICVEDKVFSHPTNIKRGRDRDQSPLLERDMVKWTRRSRGAYSKSFTPS